MRNKRKNLISVDELGKTALESRNKLKKSALKILNKKGSPAMRVEDISRGAGLAKGLFYRYFQDMHAIIHELAVDVFNEINQKPHDIPNSLHPYDWLYKYISIPIALFSSNPGLLACMFELHGTFPGLSQSWKEDSHIWNIRLGDYLVKVTGMSKKNSYQFAFVLGAMMEGIIYQNFVRNTQDLKNIGERQDQVTEIIATCWYRAIFLELPPKQKIKYEKGLLAISKKTVGY